MNFTFRDAKTSGNAIKQFFIYAIPYFALTTHFLHYTVFFSDIFTAAVTSLVVISIRYSHVKLYLAQLLFSSYVLSLYIPYLHSYRQTIYFIAYSAAYTQIHSTTFFFSFNFDYWIQFSTVIALFIGESCSRLTNFFIFYTLCFMLSSLALVDFPYYEKSACHFNELKNILSDPVILAYEYKVYVMKFGATNHEKIVSILFNRTLDSLLTFDCQCWLFLFYINSNRLLFLLAALTNLLVGPRSVDLIPFICFYLQILQITWTPLIVFYRSFDTRNPIMRLLVNLVLIRLVSSTVHV